MNESEIKSLRQKIRKGSSDLLSIKPFAAGMYAVAMFMISYYSRVREKLKIDYDSFMIIQTVVSHSLYLLSKKQSGSKSYHELEKEWEKLLSKSELALRVGILRDNIEDLSNEKNNLKLTISSICLVTSLPKETVRRKVDNLCKRNLLNISKRDGILLGSMYKKVFSDFTPQTTTEVSKLIKSWDRAGIIKTILSFKM